MVVKGNIMKKEENIEYRYFFYVTITIILILYHTQFRFGYGDVFQVYGDVLRRGSDFFPEEATFLDAIYNFLEWHYLQWSPRVVIGTILVFVSHIPIICWNILDIIVVIYIGYALEQLVVIKNLKIKYISMLTLFLAYRVPAMGSAGWIATTMNYSWLLASGLFVVLKIRKIRNGEQLSKLEYIWMILAAIFAMNQEQMNGLFLMCMIGVFFIDYKNNSVKKTLIPLGIINLLELLWMLLCPGNPLRNHLEAQYFLPEYEQYSLKRKMYEGLSCLLKAVFDKNGLGYITFFILLLLAYLTCKNKKAVSIRIVSIFTLCYSVLKLMSVNCVYLSKISIFVDYRANKLAAIVGSFTLILCFLLCISYMENKLEMIWLFVAGGATKAVLGFSLAFFASGERTSIFLGAILIFAALKIVQEHEKEFLFFDRKWFYAVLGIVNIGLFIGNYKDLLNCIYF